jgi:hypothetical protein
MIRRVVVGAVVAAVAATFIACSSSSAPQSTTPAAPTPAVATVDPFVGNWSVDEPPGTVDPAADPTAFDPAVFDPAVASTAGPVNCSHVEFRVVREPDPKGAVIVFAATCARVRFRGEGKGVLTDGVLVWKAQGQVTLPSDKTCAFRFVEGNRAVPVSDGLIKVTYNGTVCDRRFAGTTLVRRR